MASSLYKLGEKCKDILGKGDLQALISSCQDAYGSVIKKEWYENITEGTYEVDGNNLTTFKDLVPILDFELDEYFIVIPSSYLRLPHEMGINQVSAMPVRNNCGTISIKSQTAPFVRVTAGSQGIWHGLKSSLLGGRQTYYVEGIRMYFPKMTTTTLGNILLKLAIALDTIDPYEDLNIAPNVADMIVAMVVAKYQIKPEVKPDTLQ